jgi:hypothetical protein
MLKHVLWPLPPMRAGSRHSASCHALEICPSLRVCLSRSSKLWTTVSAWSDHHPRCDKRSGAKSPRLVLHTSCANSLSETYRSVHHSKQSRPCVRSSFQIWRGKRQISDETISIEGDGPPDRALLQATRSLGGWRGLAGRYSRRCFWFLPYQERAGCRCHIGLTHQALADKEGRDAHAL